MKTILNKTQSTEILRDLASVTCQVISVNTSVYKENDLLLGIQELLAMYHEKEREIEQLVAGIEELKTVAQELNKQADEFKNSMLYQLSEGAEYEL